MPNTRTVRNLNGNGSTEKKSKVATEKPILLDAKVEKSPKQQEIVPVEAVTASRIVNRFTVQRVTENPFLSSEGKESSTTKDLSSISSKAAGDRLVRQLERNLSSLNIDCSGDTSFSSDSGISISPPETKLRKTPFERFSKSSGLALRRRTVSDCVLTPGMHGILKMSSNDDILRSPVPPRRKRVSICEDHNATKFFHSTCSIEEQTRHSLKNEKKRLKKQLREQRKAEEETMKSEEEHNE